MNRAYIFDLDGTLVDSYRALAASLNYVRGAAGLPPLAVRDVRRLVGEGLHRLIERGVPGLPAAKGVRMFRDHHPSVILGETRVLPGAVTVLRTLSARDRRIGVATNKPGDFCTRILEHTGLLPFVSEVWDPTRAGAPKPDPAMLRGAVRSLDSTPAESVYLGDMTIDVAVARRAGVRVWSVPTGGSTAEDLAAARPDRLLERLSDAIAWDEQESGSGPESAPS